ncbi:hypothetical protein ONZ45_g9495 [Pleurotus djamor]|nr:hypothetical protein ONZ45_g9495 [Pleurotus djamor]
MYFDSHTSGASSSSSSRTLSRRREEGADGPVSKRAKLDHGLTRFVNMTPSAAASLMPVSPSASGSSATSTQTSDLARDEDIDNVSAMLRTSTTSLSLTEMKRDPTYYMDDGSCVLLIEDTLFNVHRSMLARDNSSFVAMFSLPQGDNMAEGASDTNPIVLVGETPEEFRHFLWALYALPHELRVVNSPSADLNQLIAIARVANKYSFKSLETWALDAIQEYVNRKPSPIINSSPSVYLFLPLGSNAPNSLPTTPNAETTSQLTRLIRLAQMCTHEKLLNTMVSLLKQLMSSSVQYAYLAMTLADELDLRELKGPAYLEVMHKAMLVSKIPVELPAKPNHDDADSLVLNPSQQLRLLSGYYRLSRLWEGLRHTPPAFDHAPACGATWHQHGCTQSWLEFWKEKTRGDAVLAIGLADILGRMRQVQKEFDRWGSATYMHHDCRNSARKSIQELIKGVEDALPEYFSDEPAAF